MSATGTRPKIRGALRRGSADVTPSGGVAYTARAINQALGGAWFYVVWGRWCARWSVYPFWAG